jgi:hypothetical protein
MQVDLFFNPEQLVFLCWAKTKKLATSLCQVIWPMKHYSFKLKLLALSR